MRTARLINTDVIWRLAQIRLNAKPPRGDDPFAVYIETRAEAGDTVLVQPLFLQREVARNAGDGKKIVFITAKELMRATELATMNELRMAAAKKAEGGA